MRTRRVMTVGKCQCSVESELIIDTAHPHLINVIIIVVADTPTSVSNSVLIFLPQEDNFCTKNSSQCK